MQKRYRRTPNVFYLPFENISLYYLAEKNRVVSYWMLPGRNARTSKPRRGFFTGKTRAAEQDVDAGSSERE